MNESFPELHVKSIENIPYEDGSEAPISLRLENGELMPLFTFGDGVRRWFTILGNMALARNGMQCIEEFDVTFHRDVQKQLARNMYRYSERYGTQLFMTTHNVKMLNNFLRALQKENPDSNSGSYEFNGLDRVS